MDETRSSRDGERSRARAKDLVHDQGGPVLQAMRQVLLRRQIEVGHQGVGRCTPVGTRSGVREEQASLVDRRFEAGHRTGAQVAMKLGELNSTS